MDLTVQAVVMGLVQGLTEFLPISSSGHLILVPYLLHWQDPFITSLPFSVMLHLGTLVALLVYFWRDWLELVPAGLAVLRDRSFVDPSRPVDPPPPEGSWVAVAPAGGRSRPSEVADAAGRSDRADPRRRLAWLIVVSMIPAVIAGPLLSDAFEQAVRRPALVAITLVVGAAILWLAERWGSRSRDLEALGFGGALAIGVAQAIALVPGISRSGISIAAGLFLGLDRESAARFSFLMAAPIIAGAGLFEARKLVGPGAEAVPVAPLVAGFVAAAIAGLVAIHVLLAYLRTHSTGLFIAYRVALAALVAVTLLA